MTEASPDEEQDTGRIGRRGRRALLAVAALTTAAVTGVAGLDRFGREDHLTKARAVMRDDAEFATATDAGAAFIQVSSLLQAAGEQCLREGRGPSCDHLFVTAAYSRVSAVSVLSCTRRGIAEARRALREHLEAIAERPAESLPPTPRCDN